MFEKKKKFGLCALAGFFFFREEKTKFVKNYTVLYENSTGKGVYTYTVTNLTKGQRVKWSLSGTGKSYAKLKKTTTSVSGKTSANSLTIRTRGKAAAKNKTVIVTAKSLQREEVREHDQDKVCQD